MCSPGKWGYAKVALFEMLESNIALSVEGYKMLIDMLGKDRRVDEA